MTDTYTPTSHRYKRRFCPDCKGHIAVNTDGNFRRHRHVTKGYICDASGTPAPVGHVVPDFNAAR